MPWLKSYPWHAFTSWYYNSWSKTILLSQKNRKFYRVPHHRISGLADEIRGISGFRSPRQSSLSHDSTSTNDWLSGFDHYLVGSQKIQWLVVVLPSATPYSKLKKTPRLHVPFISSSSICNFWPWRIARSPLQAKYALIFGCSTQLISIMQSVTPKSLSSIPLLHRCMLT